MVVSLANFHHNQVSQDLNHYLVFSLLLLVELFAAAIAHFLIQSGFGSSMINSVDHFGPNLVAMDLDMCLELGYGNLNFTKPILGSICPNYFRLKSSENLIEQFMSSFTLSF